MITVHQHRDEAAGPWLAVCEVDGRIYTAKSRSGAAFALARVLADRGIPDAPMLVRTAGQKREIRHRSFREMAGYDVAVDQLQPA